MNKWFKFLVLFMLFMALNYNQRLFFLKVLLALLLFISLLYVYFNYNQRLFFNILNGIGQKILLARSGPITYEGETKIIDATPSIKIWTEFLKTPVSNCKGTIVLISGAGNPSLQMVKSIYQPLLDEGYNVIRYDSRDTGLSTWIYDYSKNPYHLKDMASDTIAVLNAWNVDKAHIVGRSMGGMVTQEIGIHFPERVLSLTILFSAAYNNLEKSLPPEKLQLLKPLYPHSSLYDKLVNFKMLLKLFEGTKYPFDIETLNWVREKSIARGGSNPLCNHTYAILNTPEERHEALKQVKAPTLVIHGTDDKVLNISAGREIASLIPNSRFIEWEGVGHEIPRQVNFPKTLIDFLSTLNT